MSSDKSGDKPADKPATSEATTAPDPKSKTPPHAKAAPATPGRLRGRLIGLLLLAVFAGGAYLYWKLQQSARPPAGLSFDGPPLESAPAAPPPAARLTESPPIVETLVETLPPAAPPPAPEPLSEPAPDLPALESPPPAVDANAELSARLAELEASVSALAATPAPVALPADATSLAIAEAGDLVALAEQRLLLARDLVGATAALRLAVSRLASGEFPAQRRAMLADLAALEAFRDVDAAALSVELAELARRAVSFPLRGPAPLASPAPLAPVEGWRGLVQAVWTSLRGLVEVRDADGTRDPLLDPAHMTLARQQLALDLSAARIGVLQRDPAAFSAALTPALDALTATFDTTDAAVGAALARLREMRGIDLAPALPTLSRSVDALAAVPATVTAAPEPPAAAPEVEAPTEAPAPGPETAL